THLVGPGVEHGANVFNFANTAAHGERNKHLGGNLLNRVHRGIAALVAGGNIQKGNLVGTGLVIALGNFHRVAGIADIHKLHAVHDAAIVYVQTGDSSFGKSHGLTLLG